MPIKRRRRKKPEDTNTKKLSIETILKISKDLEEILTEYYGAEGRSLRDKTLSIHDRLPYAIQYSLFKINHIRNQAAHESNFNIKDINKDNSVDKYNADKYPFDLIGCYEETRHFLITDELLTRKQ